jgi:hypothetical protein
MTNSARRAARPAGSAHVVFIAWVAVLFHGAAHPALPSGLEDAPVASPAVQQNNVPAEVADSQNIIWSLPLVRLGGTVSYGLGRDSSNEINNMHSGLTTTLNASTSTFIWQPWFARLNAGLGFTKTSNNSGSDVPDTDSNSENVIVTGSGQLSVLSQSKFPFEAHFDRSNNRVDSNLAGSSSDSSQRYGFTQRHYRPEGEAMFGWDRNRQSSADFGDGVQDSLQLQATHRLENHQLQLQGNRSTNRQEVTDEQASQDNLSVQDNYTPDPSLSVVSVANISRSELHLQQGNNATRMVQLGSNAFWRGDEQPVSVNGGVRVMALGADQNGYGSVGDSAGSRFVTANANAGVSYDYSQFTRLNAAFNANSTDNGGVSSTQTSQSVGASYQPEGIDFGPARYNWGTSANASNQIGSDHSERALVLQISHSLSQSFKLDGGSTISADVNQGLSANATSSSTVTETEVPSSSHRQLTHGGSLSWDLSQLAGAALLRLSASDSRALDGNQAYFQLVNFQASSTLPMNGYSSWTGALTIQAVRQGQNANGANTQSEEGVMTSSNGSLSYQTQRVFGIRNLRFGSDVRLNLQSQQSQQSQQSYLSQFESRTDQEAAAWLNRLDYTIGRTQLRLNTMVSRSLATRRGGGLAGDGVMQTNRSINFTVSRSFGLF